MKVAIIGSQQKSFTDKQMDTAVLLIDMFLFYRERMLTLVISGGATGVDTWGIRLALANLIPTNIIYPVNPQWEPQGFRDRNIQVAHACDEVLCIRSSTSKTYGSGWTADYAERLHKRVWRYTV